MQKLAVPVAIVIAGALVAVAVYFVGINRPAATTGTNTVATKIRDVQKDDHIIGNPNAQIKIVEYSDPECPFCKQFQNTLHQVIDAYGASGEVAWIYRHWPIPQLHPKAPKEAEAFECAAAQGGNDMFWKYADKVFEATNSNNSLDDGVYNTPATPPTDASGQPYYTQKTPRSTTDAGQLSDIAVSLGLDKAKFESCLASGTSKAHIDKDTAEALAAGGQGTPFSIVIVGKEQVPIDGAQSYETVKGLIDTLLKK